MKTLFRVLALLPLPVLHAVGAALGWVSFLVSGTYALACYTGVARPTKDIDVFAKAGDSLKILSYFKEKGFDIQVVDERWLARIVRGDRFGHEVGDRMLGLRVAEAAGDHRQHAGEFLVAKVDTENNRAITYLNVADRLYQLPLGLIGIAVGCFTGIPIGPANCSCCCFSRATEIR